MLIASTSRCCIFLFPHSFSRFSFSFYLAAFCPHCVFCWKNNREPLPPGFFFPLVSTFLPKAVCFFCVWGPMAASIRQRGEYLKNGCKECKRRKIKCDEFVDPPKGVAAKINAQGRPLCWQCTRLGKECVYPRRGERVARVSRKAMMLQSMAHASTMQDVSVMAPSVSTTVAAHATARNAVSVLPHVPPAPQASQAPYASQAQPVT